MKKSFPKRRTFQEEGLFFLLAISVKKCEQIAAAKIQDWRKLQSSAHKNNVFCGRSAIIIQKFFFHCSTMHFVISREAHAYHNKIFVN